MVVVHHEETCSSWAESFAGSAAMTCRTSATVGFIFDFQSLRPGLTPLTRLRRGQAVALELPEPPCRRDQVPRPCPALPRWPLRLTKRSRRQTWLRGERHPAELTSRHELMATITTAYEIVPGSSTVDDGPGIPNASIRLQMWAWMGPECGPKRRLWRNKMRP
jgi:hypothetical protein